LAKYIKLSKVHALDVSLDALKVAETNAKLNNIEASFIEADIFEIKKTNIKYDIIVSNPPYVLEKDKEILWSNVVKYEPHLALFVNNDNPLIFYEEISSFASNNLNEQGKLYFEINELYGDDIKRIFRIYKFENIEIKKDINGKDRMIKAEIY